MADVKWIKIYTDMVSNKKIKRIRTLPEGNNIVLIWVLLLSQAGECNKSGALYLTDTLPFRPEDLAVEFDFEVPVINLAIITLEKFSMIEVFDEVIYIKNWGEYQNIDGMEKIREQTRIRTAAYREKQKQLPSRDATCDVTVTQGDATELELELELDKELDIINNINAKNEISVTKETETEVVTLAIGTQAVNWAEKNWGRMMSPGETDSIIAWCDQFSINGSEDPDAVITEALRNCLDANVKNMKYLRAVLTDWREAGVLSVAHVKAREVERKDQKENKRGKDPGDKPASKRKSVV